MSSAACRVCGNTAFEEDEGFSFCQECGTQAEATQREEATDDMVFRSGKWASERRATNAGTDFLSGTSQPDEPVVTASRTAKLYSSRRAAQLEEMQLLREGKLMRLSGEAGQSGGGGVVLYDDEYPLPDSAEVCNGYIATESEDESAGNSGDEAAGSRARPPAGSSASMPAEDPGKAAAPWTLVEGLQVVLRAQVEALVCAGFPSELEDVVGQLWFLYLRYCGLAFTDDPAKEEALHTSFRKEGVKRRKKFRKADRKSRKRRRVHPADDDDDDGGGDSKSVLSSSPTRPSVRREADGTAARSAEGPVAGAAAAGSGAAPSTPAPGRGGLRRQRRRPGKTSRVRFNNVAEVCKDEVASADSDDSGTMSDYAEQKLQDGREVDHGSADVENEDDSDSEASSDNELPSNPGSFQQPIWTNHKAEMKQPRLLHLLALNYLALLSLGEPLLASDMCNMTKQGWFPYFNIDYLLDDHMELWNYQYRIFRLARVPCPKTVYIIAHDLATAIDLPLPPIDLGAIAARFLRDLSLPASLAPCFESLMLLAPLPRHPVVSGKTRQRAWRDLNLDICCMASLVVVIKLVYGLDDDVEWRQAEASQLIGWDLSTQSPVDPDHDGLVPIWQDWLAMYSDQARGSLSTPSLRYQRHNLRSVSNCEMIVNGRHGQLLMPPPSIHSKNEVYGLRKDVCQLHRHTFLNAATGGWASPSYSPVVPTRLNSTDDGSSATMASEPQLATSSAPQSAAARLVHAFPLVFSLRDSVGPAATRGRRRQRQEQPVSRCLFSGREYVRYIPAAQLQPHQSYAFLLDVCSEYIACSVTALKRQVLQVEGRAFQSANVDLLAL